MCPKPRPTFNKLQKERARQQKQRDKIERKNLRKMEKVTGGSSPDEEIGSAPAENPNDVIDFPTPSE